jgi:hypothetical protein
VQQARSGRIQDAVKQITERVIGVTEVGQDVFHSLVWPTNATVCSIGDSELQGSRNSSSESGMKRSQRGARHPKRPR